MLSANPNGLAIVGSLFLLAGFAILGSLLLSRSVLANFPQSSFVTAAKNHVAAAFAIPTIGAGLFLQAVSNVVSTPIGPGLSILALALALGLLLFLMIDETITHGVSDFALRRSSDMPAALPAPVIVQKPAAVAQSAAHGTNAPRDSSTLDVAV